MNAIPDRSAPALLAWLLVSQLLLLPALALWSLAGGFAILAFDAGISPGAVLLAGAVWSYPPLALLCAALAWVARRRGRNTRAAVLSGLSLVPPLLYAAWLFGTPA